MLERAGLSPLPWSYHNDPHHGTFGRDWIEDANGNVVVESIGRIDGLWIVERANAYLDAVGGETENQRLRAVISKVCEALPNGAFCSPDCSVEFMEHVPSEVASVIASLSPATTTDERAVEALREIVSITMMRHIGPDGWTIGRGGCPRINWQQLCNELVAALAQGESR
jgi:hypothetical protein